MLNRGLGTYDAGCKDVCGCARCVGEGRGALGRLLAALFGNEEEACGFVDLSCNGKFRGNSDLCSLLHGSVR